MSITQAIASAESGLSVAERRLAIASDDIANAQTPGHMNKTAVVTSGRGVSGVRVEVIERAADGFLQADRRAADADAAAARTLADVNIRLAAAVGEFGDADGLAQHLDRAVAGLALLQADPGGAIQLADTRDRLEDFANAINGAYRTIRTEQTRLEEALEDDLETMRKAVRTIAGADSGASDALGATLASAGDVADLATDQLNATLPAVAGLAAGTADDTVALRFGNAILRLGVDTDLARVTTASGDPAISVGERVIRLADLAGPGALGARATLLSDTIPSALSALDALAGQLVDAFSGMAVDPTLTAGEQGIFVDPLRIGGSGPPGGAARLALNPALIAPGGESTLLNGLGGAGPTPASTDEIARTAIRALRGEDGSSGAVDPASVAARVADLGESLSRARLDAEETEDLAETRRQSLAALEGAAVGVDRDAEIVESTLIERYFSANAQVLNTAISMLDELIAIAR